MKLYIIKYTDESDAGCPVFEARIRARSSIEAQLRFEESNADLGWVILSTLGPVRES